VPLTGSLPVFREKSTEEATLTCASRSCRSMSSDSTLRRACPALRSFRPNNCGTRPFDIPAADHTVQKYVSTNAATNKNVILDWFRNRLHLSDVRLDKSLDRASNCESHGTQTDWSLIAGAPAMPPRPWIAQCVGDDSSARATRVQGPRTGQRHSLRARIDRAVKQ